MVWLMLVGLSPPPPVPNAITGQPTHACSHCNAVFETRQQLAVHKYSAHRVKAEAAILHAIPSVEVALSSTGSLRGYNATLSTVGLTARPFSSRTGSRVPPLHCRQILLVQRASLPAVRLYGPLFPRCLTLHITGCLIRPTWRGQPAPYPGCTPAITDALQCFIDAWG